LWRDSGDSRIGHSFRHQQPSKRNAGYIKEKGDAFSIDWDNVK